MASVVKSLASSTALLLLAACGGGERIEGMSLSLGITTARTRSAPVPSSGRTLVTDAGAEATLSGARFTLGSVELLPCESTGWRWQRLWDALSPVGTAWAHTVSSATRLGTPHVITLRDRDGEVLPLGELRPAPGRYCRARLTFEPADDDAVGLSDAQGSDMVGLSLHVSGTVAGADGATPFDVKARGRSSVDVSLDGLELSEDAPRATRVFTLAWDSWLDGLAPGGSPGNLDVLGNVARSASLQTSAEP